MKRLQLNDLAPRLLSNVDLTPTGDSGILMPQTEIYTSEEAEKHELGLEKILDDILTSSSRVPPDLRIDDRDIKEFPNFYSFAFSKQGLDQAPFARQLAIATWLFAEHCPDCTKSKAINTYNIHGIPVDFPAQDFPDRVQFLHHGKCPKCGKHRVDFFKSRQLRPYYEFTGCLGQRAGKSALLGQLAPYMTHRWLKLQRPVQALGLMKNSILVGTMVALTWQKAMELLFQPFMNAVNDSPWFTLYHELLDHYGEKHGVELYKAKDTFLNYFHRNLFISPSGPNKRTLRGACLTGDTLLSTSEGLLHFDELVSKSGQHPVSDLYTDSHRGRRKVSHTYKTRRDTLKVTTRNGYEIKGTHEHPLLIITPDLKFVWRRLDQLKVGDWIVSKTKKSKPLYGTKEVSLNMARILGFMTANGHMTDFSSNDKFVIERFNEDVKNVIGVYPTYTEGDENRAANHRISMGNRGKAGGFFSNYMEPLGYTFRNSKEKRIPLSIRQSSQKVIHQYLSAYFACDCYIDGFKANPEIMISSASNTLIREIQTILLHYYGIVSRYHVRDFVPVSQRNLEEGYVTQSYMLSISGYDIKLFAESFPQAKAVRNYPERIANVTPERGRGSDRRKVPWVKGYLENLWESARMKDPDGKILRRLVTTGGGCILNSRNPKCFNRQNKTPHTTEHLFYDAEDWGELFKIIKQIAPNSVSRIKHLLRLEPHFEEVIRIEDNGRADVYDLTVPKGKAFYANGLASHNTRWLALIDELGWFPHGEENDSKERASANEVYVSLDRSLKTVRMASKNRMKSGLYNMPFAYMMSISSPSSYMDKIMTLVRTYENSKEVLTIHLPTWEMNPLFKKTDFAKEYLDDPVKAERDFGANPPMSENPWLGDPSIVHDLMKGRNRRIKYGYKHRQNRSGLNERFARIESIKPPQYCPGSVISIDAGYANNSFALTVMHPVMREDRLGAKVVAIVEVAPQRGQNVLNYSLLCRELLFPLIEKFNVQLVVADRWQSLKLLSDIELEYGIYTEQYSLRAEDCILIRDYLLTEGEELIDLPKPELSPAEISKLDIDTYPHCFKYKPVSHLYHQFGTVSVDARGVIQKGEGYTDDIVRALTLGLTYCLDEGCVESFGLLETEVVQVDIAYGSRTPGDYSKLEFGSRGGGGTSIIGSRG